MTGGGQQSRSAWQRASGPEEFLREGCSVEPVQHARPLAGVRASAQQERGWEEAVQSPQAVQNPCSLRGCRGRFLLHPLPGRRGRG